MIANASEAVDRLRHKRTGTLQATKVIERNTRLAYYADELVALRFHHTDIALYMDDCVRLDTRANPEHPSPHGEGWFTVTTWQRIDSWTPAHTFTSDGLRYVLDVTAGSGSIYERSTSRLYTPGMIVRPDGSIDPTTILEPELQDRIVRIKSGHTAKSKRYAKKVVKEWAKFRPCERCCIDVASQAPDQNNERLAHTIAHFEANEYVVPPDMEGWANSMRPDIHGPELLASLANTLTDRLQSLERARIKQVCPDFPYPQLPKRAR